jgi:hypothetical protein
MKTKETAVHAALRGRIKILGVRAAALQRSMLAAGGSHRISRLAQAEDLEQRHAHLAETLQQLDRAGPGFLQEAKAALELLADDYEGLLDGLMASTEAHYAADQKRVKHVQS